MDWTDYTEAQFTTVMQVPDPKSTTMPAALKWTAGFFCQGEDSMINTGEVCFTNEQMRSAFIRTQQLSPLEDDPETAIASAYALWKAVNP